jgi:plastocyanin
MKKLVPLLLMLALAGGTLAACGDDDESTDAAESSDVNPETDTIEVSAPSDGSLRFDQDSLDANAGTITVTFENPAPTAHDFCIEAEDGDELGCTDLVADGDTATQQFELEAGKYTFYCSVAGHREAGMEGELTVK